MSTIKLTADSGSGTVSIKAPSSTGSNGHREFTLPDTYSGNGSLVTANSSGQILINTATSREIGGGNAELQIENTNTESISIARTSADGGSAYLNFGKTRNGSVVQSGDGLGSIAFHGDDGTDINTPGAEIRAFVEGTPGSNDMPGRLSFYTTADGASTTSERIRLRPDGNVLIAMQNFNSTPSASNYGISLNNTNSGSVWAAGGSSESTHIIWANTNGTCGTIKTDGTSTAYNTSSDYRLKENIVGITDGITRVKQLAPKRFNFKTNSSKVLDGFLAHEVTPIVPESVSGTKDEVDSDGKIVPQGIDQAKLVPLLTAALQEAIAKIEVLETKVAALEAK